MRSPFWRLKSLTQPTRSEGSPFSIRLSRILGCQRGMPLKSRTRSQTFSAGALMTLETKTRGIVQPDYFGLLRALVGGVGGKGIGACLGIPTAIDRKSTRLNSSHVR